uniref:Pleckstrin homology domain containing, family A member 5 n=1 Tax=Nothobranchius furzeri TaxID=105023 RepID=A0A1A8UY50_NOTFU
MAADPKLDWRCSLPCSWSYGVTRDGRIFFINEEAKSTTWLHPVTGEAVITGHRKTPDLPSGWEEGYTFEGARCFINHNERKVTCKHPVSGIPSQDNCIFVVNEQSAPKASSEQDSGSDKKECPISTMSEASNYTSGSDYSIFPASPTTTTSTSTTFTSSTRPSRSSKKLHNFGKRSNSIKRNINAPVTEPPSQRHIQIQKELWRIQDVMEALSKTKPQQSADNSFPGSKPLSSLQKNETTPLLPLSPLQEGNCVPPRPPLPQYYNSSERLPTVPPHHSHPGTRPSHSSRPEERKMSCRNGAHSQNPDYRLYKSEPELTTVKEEVDEANVENKDKTEVSAETKDTPKSKVPPYPVGIVPPRTKSPMNPPESSTIASYVTLRKTKKPESRSDRPRSAVDQMGFGEREVIKARMSIEEQLERMRRNQEALLLREKRRETPSRSPSFSKDNMFLILQSQTQVQTFPDQMELEAALQQIKVAHREQDSTGPEATGGPTERVPTPPQKVQREDQLKNAKWTEKQLEADQNLLGVSETQAETNSVGSESGESQRVVIVDLGSETKRVEIVNFEPVDDDKSKEEDLVSSPTNTAEDSSFQTLSPDLKEDDTNKTQEVIQEEKSLDSYKQLTTDSKNNNMMALQTFTMVNSNT